MKIIRSLFRRRSSGRRLRATFDGSRVRKALRVFEKTRRRLESILIDTHAARASLDKQLETIRQNQTNLDNQRDRLRSTLSKLTEIIG